MLIALDGMDGVGKSTLSRKVARLLGGCRTVKSIHPLIHPGGEYDNFMDVSKLVPRRFERDYSRIGFAIRGIFLYSRLNDVPLAADRFYASNLWHVERSEADVERLIMFVGIPENTVLLFASKDILQKRISDRNPNDKDLGKVDKTDQAYRLMHERLRRYGVPYVEMSTEGQDLDALASRIAEMYGWRKPDARTQRNATRFPAFSFAPSMIRTITIPRTVNAIDAKAFFYLRRLSEIMVERGNRFFESFSGALYSAELGTFVCYPRAKRGYSYFVRTGTEVIGPSAFLNADNVVRVVLPRSLREIGSSAFFNCRKLRGLTIPSSVERIGLLNFLGCDNLERIRVTRGGSFFKMVGQVLVDARTDSAIRFPPARKTERLSIAFRVLRSWSFAECRCLRRIVISDMTVSIEAYAFLGSSVEEVQVDANNLKHIGERAFAECRTLKRVLLVDASPGLDIHPDAFEDSGGSNGIRVSVPQDVFDCIWTNPRKRKLYGVIRSILRKKRKTESCGTSCVKYVLEKSGRKAKGSFRSFWVFDVARFLSSMLGHKNVRLCCNESRLMADYFAGELERGFDGRKAIVNYLRNGESIKRRKPCRDAMIEGLKTGFVIVLVSHSFLNGSGETNGSHYVVLEEIRDGFALIVNPLANKVVKEIVRFDDLAEACEKGGGWVISILRR